MQNSFGHLALYGFCYGFSKELLVRAHGFGVSFSLNDAGRRWEMLSDAE